MGAILYRTSHILKTSSASAALAQESAEESTGLREFSQSAELLFAILNWIPTHLTALSYAITGSFVDALHHWRENRIENRIQAHLSSAAQDNLLAQVGLGSLQLLDKDNSDSLPGVIAVIELAKRSVLLWLTILAVVTLAGWAG
jgi:membrane protein required for beta-lactamase induction